MTSTTTRIIITSALAVLALAVPAASAMAQRGSDGVRTSSLAGTTSAPAQDLRNADNRAPRYVAPLRHPAPVAPAPKPVAATGGGTSPLVYIIPSLVLVGMIGAAVAYARTPRRSAA
jgi:hypothetical protein